MRNFIALVKKDSSSIDKRVICIYNISILSLVIDQFLYANL